MRCTRYDAARARLTAVAVLWTVATGVVSSMEAQGIQLASRSPRFLSAPTATAKPVEVDAQSMAVLRRRITVDANGVTLEGALRRISRAAGLRLMYSKAVVQLDRPVTFQARNITVAAALTEVLFDAGVDVLITSGDQALLTKRDDPMPRSLRGAAGSVVGKVTDTKTGAAVAQAEVFLDGTHWRGVTDTAGRYRLMDVAAGDYTLTVRRLGFTKQAQKVTVRDDHQDTVDVAMTPMATRLNDLVTTATGRRRRLDIANDVTTINADSVMQVAPVRSVTDLLENRVPGLTVQRTSGAPGDPARLRLRGVSSIMQSNDPIVFVDGLRIYAAQSAGRSANLAQFRDTAASPSTTSGANPTRNNPPYATPSPLDYIDPNTIETIEVLKGPSAATLYGQDAANGVIVITTKKGRVGPPSWTASAEQGRTQMARTTYPTLYLRWGHPVDNDTPIQCPTTGIANPEGPLGGRPCVGDSVVTFQLLNDPTLTILDRGHRTSASLGVSGGTQALTYAVTGTYGDELGLVKLPTYEADRYQALLGVAAPDWMRQPLRLNQWGVTSRITARLGTKADVALMASLSRTDQQKSSLLNDLGTLMSTYLDRASGTYYQGAGEGIFFPVPNALRDYYERATDLATAYLNGLTATWRPRNWLTLTADAGIDVTHRADNLFFPRGPANTYYDYAGAHGDDTTGYVNDAQGTAVTSTVNLRALAIRQLKGAFRVQFAAGANYAGTSTNDVAVSTHDLPPGSSLQGAITDTSQRAETSNATVDWYVEPSIGNDRLNFSTGLQLSGGGSSYGAKVNGFKLPTFPKLGFSYLVSDEPWFPLKNVFQSLRIRLTYGRANRQPSATDRLQLYNLPTQMLADSAFATSVTLKSLGNPEVRPERSGEFEGGFDADLLDSRLTLSVSGYRKTTADALLSVPVPTSVYGNNLSITKNIGVTRNTGLEMTASAQLVRSGPITWTTQLSMVQRRDLVVSLGPGVAPFYTSGNQDGGGQRVVAGYPINGRWSRPIIGYADANGDGALEIQEVQLGDTAVYVGNTLPDYDATLNTTVSLWHGALAFNAGFSYQNGLTQRNNLAQNLAVFSAGSQVPGTSLAQQAATMDLKLPGSNLEPSTDYNYLQTVNVLRFTSLSIGYNVPVGVARRLGARQLSVAVQSDNLNLWTNYRGLDPNVNAFGTGNSVMDTGNLPVPRTWQIRIHATY